MFEGMSEETIFFGEVCAEDMDYTDLSTVFRKGDKYFWYKIVFQEDQIVLWDTCDRHFPVSYEHINMLDAVVGFACDKFNIVNDHYHQAMWEINKLRKETHENLDLL